MKYLNKFHHALRGFWGDTRGNVSIEMIIWMPLVFSAMAVVYSLFEDFRHNGLNVKAAYTISDAFSRETDPVSDDYLDGMYNLMGFLTSDDADNGLRVTLIRYDANNDVYHSVWSQTRGKFTSLQTPNMSDLRAQLPNLVNNERVILVETATMYSPPLAKAGIGSERVIYNFGFTRPRFAPQVVWEDSQSS